jgi:hypothetical protein
MAHTDVWWHRPWIRATENVLGHIAAVIIGLVMMVAGLGLGVTMIMLPVGLVIGLIGVAMVVGGFFARIDQKA